MKLKMDSLYNIHLENIRIGEHEMFICKKRLL